MRPSSLTGFLPGDVFVDYFLYLLPLPDLRNADYYLNLVSFCTVRFIALPLAPFAYKGFTGSHPSVRLLSHICRRSGEVLDGPV